MIYARTQQSILNIYFSYLSIPSLENNFIQQLFFLMGLKWFLFVDEWSILLILAVTSKFPPCFLQLGRRLLCL